MTVLDLIAECERVQRRNFDVQQSLIDDAPVLIRAGVLIEADVAGTAPPADPFPGANDSASLSTSTKEES